MNLLSTYNSFTQAYPAQGALSLYRKAGHDFANSKGLPTRQDEDWHYTSVKVLSEVNFMPSSFNTALPSHETMSLIEKKLNPQFTNLVFFNGVLNRTLSDQLPEGVSLKESTEFSNNFHDTFEALNAAYITQPYSFVIEKEVSVENPVNFVFFTSLEGGPALMVHPRIHINIQAKSSAKILESYYGVSGVSYFVNSYCEIELAQDSKLIYSRIQSESENAINIGRTEINLQKNSNLQSLVLGAGAGLSRHSLNVKLKGIGAHADVLGIYALSGSQHLDNTTLIDHQIGECTTNQLYKGILDSESRSAFCGKIIIRKGAQKASSSQLNNNLLLSSKAEADSKPNLEIFADDVKASHGSTVGQMNREELFYLLSRAIPKQKAISMLSYGFLSEVINKLSDEKIQDWLTNHLKEAFSRLDIGVNK